MKNFQRKLTKTPCSAGKQKGALLFSTKLQALSKETVVEQFSAVPMAYKMGFRLPPILYLCTLLFLISCLGRFYSDPHRNLNLLWGNGLNFNLIDVFSRNINPKMFSPKIKPVNASQKLVVFGAHIDSNWEFPF